MLRGTLAAAAVVVTAVTAAASAQHPDPTTVAGRVAAAEIRRHTTVLASDAFAGRAPGSRGGELAADYVVRTLQGLGARTVLEDGSLLQQVPLVGSKPLAAACRLLLSGPGVEEALRLGTDYLLATTGAQTWLPRAVPMVFVGYGIVAPELDYNDYADVDVRGKVVVFLEGEPSSDDTTYFAGDAFTPYAALETKLRIALSRGALGSVLLTTGGRDADARWAARQRAYAFEELSLAYDVPHHLAVVLNPKVAPRLFAGAAWNLDQVLTMAAGHTMRSFPLERSLRFEGEFATRTFLAPNIVAAIPGTDPALADDFVVVSAHYDHLGVGPPDDRGDTIYNGAVDNALGVACVLEVARVLSQPEMRPRRSLLLLLTTAEEEGNLGSQYFLDHAPVPPARMTADINVDGLAFQDDFADVVGVGGDLSDLGRTLERTAATLSLEVSRPTEVLVGPEAYGRSDQVVFAEAGVPAILVNEGFTWRHVGRDQAVTRTVAWLATTYHTPADDLDQPLDFDAAARHCGVIAALAHAVAESDREPRWRAGVRYRYERLLSQARNP